MPVEFVGRKNRVKPSVNTKWRKPPKQTEPASLRIRQRSPSLGLWATARTFRVKSASLPKSRDFTCKATEDSFGVMSEIANFVSVPEIHSKAAILFPAKFYIPNESLPANTVQAYHDKMQYTDEDIEICRLVHQCIDWASERRMESWSGIAAQGF